jgi:hypothetical protein
LALMGEEVNMQDRARRDLEDALSPVAAPDGLWDRIQQRLEAPPPPNLTQPRGFGWAVAAGVIAALSASWLAVASRTPAGDSFAVATFREVCGHPERLSVKTGDLVELRRWAGEHAILLGAAGAGPAQDVRIAGAAPLRNRPGIAVAYRRGGEWSALLIEPSHQAASKRIARGTRGGFAIFEWRGRNQRYTLITRDYDRAEAACGLCHPGSTAGSV